MRRSLPSAFPSIPDHPTLPELAAACRSCEACDLYKHATQTVFGEGSQAAQVMLVGEQPGDREDHTGHPFVGPAGAVLDQALTAAGIDRSRVYTTNVVKHFKWEPRGKRRIHKKPNSLEVAACRPWLDSEIAVLRPQVIVCLGATAAQAILGRNFKVTQRRGQWITDTHLAPWVMATVHPSSILRAMDDVARHDEMARLVDDLRQVAQVSKRVNPAA